MFNYDDAIAEWFVLENNFCMTDSEPSSNFSINKPNYGTFVVSTCKQWDLQNFFGELTRCSEAHSPDVQPITITQVWSVNC